MKNRLRTTVPMVTIHLVRKQGSSGIVSFSPEDRTTPVAWMPQYMASEVAFGENNAGLLFLSFLNRFCAANHALGVTRQNVGWDRSDGVSMDREFDRVFQAPVVLDRLWVSKQTTGANAASVLPGAVKVHCIPDFRIQKE